MDGLTITVFVDSGLRGVSCFLALSVTCPATCQNPVGICAAIGYGMKLKHTTDSLRLTEFAQRNDGWQSYSRDAKTVQALKRAELIGEVEVSYDTHQFRYIPVVSRITPQ
jgi:hypothetical protein